VSQTGDDSIFAACHPRCILVLTYKLLLCVVGDDRCSLFSLVLSVCLSAPQGKHTWLPFSVSKCVRFSYLPPHISPIEPQSAAVAAVQVNARNRPTRLLGGSLLLKYRHSNDMKFKQVLVLIKLKGNLN